MNTNANKILYIFIGGLLIWAVASAGKLTQPVAFNHNLHISDLEMDCSDCHLYVMNSRKATLPDKNVCIDCHEEPLGESAEEQKLVSLLQSEQELMWKRIYVLPKHVYFSHFRHVTLGQIGCLNCHGEMKKLTSPPTKQAVNVSDMNFCLDCHDEKQVSNDCLTCHN